ncbi:MAG: cyclic peptide export ABC transporter [Bacteroidota bacterium]
MEPKVPSLFDLLTATVSKWELTKIVGVGILSGGINFLFLALLNHMIALLINDQYKVFDLNYAMLFAFVIIAFIWSRKALTEYMIELSQQLFWKIRMDVLYIVLGASYVQLSSRRSQVQSVLINDVNILTQASLNIINFITSTVVVIACLIYMAFQSFTLFASTLLVSVLGILIYSLAARKNNDRFERARELENGFIHHFDAIIDGFKEIKLNIQKGKDIFHNKIHPLAHDSYQSNTGAFIGFLNNQMTGQILFYFLVSSIIVFFSVYLQETAATIVNFLFILLYLLGSIETIMVLLPGLMQAGVSGRRIAQLRSDLEPEEIQLLSSKQVSPSVPFASLELQQIYFQYDKREDSTEEAFGIGPLNLKVEKGDIVFIFGGNGSGKTTLIHTLLGLLKAQKGRIFCNDQALDPDDMSTYKSLFSTVFNDFYLFDEFYGLESFSREAADEYLALFEIQDKVDILDNGFSTTSLSTGQRKRLALIAALLEEKPILVLDEWAADQDPYFRRKFYTQIIPLLKKKGITLLAITHDDNYYHCADKLYKMEYGKLLEESSVVAQEA